MSKQKYYVALNNVNMPEDIKMHFESIGIFLDEEELILRTNDSSENNPIFHSVNEAGKDSDTVVVNMSGEAPTFNIVKRRANTKTDMINEVRNNLAGSDKEELRRSYEYEALLDGTYDMSGPSMFLLCWTNPNEYEKQQSDIEIEQAIKIAEDIDIPVINANQTTWLQQVVNLVR